MNSFAVRLTNISKKYIIHYERPTLVENILGRGIRGEFWALKDINLTVRKGEKVGVIGPNGSGKTTLLKIIAGITSPTSGTVETCGKIVSLIELQAGFHADLSGRENIMLNGLLIGMSKKLIRERMKDIIDFSDIGKFIDAPFYTYSSGMALRLGFSIAVHADLDILILDENIAVGDQDFIAKSQKKMREFFRQNKTVILVSHWLEFIKNNCTLTALMKRGEIEKVGSYSSVVRFY